MHAKCLIFQFCYDSMFVDYKVHFNMQNCAEILATERPKCLTQLIHTRIQFLSIFNNIIIAFYVSQKYRKVFHIHFTQIYYFYIKLIIVHPLIYNVVLHFKGKLVKSQPDKCQIWAKNIAGFKSEPCFVILFPIQYDNNFKFNTHKRCLKHINNCNYLSCLKNIFKKVSAP